MSWLRRFWARLRGQTVPPPDPCCSFCGRNWRQAGILVGGTVGKSLICGGCADVCSTMIANERRRRGEAGEADAGPVPLLAARREEVSPAMAPPPAEGVRPPAP